MLEKLSWNGCKIRWHSRKIFLFRTMCQYQVIWSVAFYSLLPFGKCAVVQGKVVCTAIVPTAFEKIAINTTSVFCASFTVVSLHNQEYQNNRGWECLNGQGPAQALVASIKLDSYPRI